MSTTFNADEIFEIAKQIERNGAAFYRKAAERNPKAKDMLLGLAAQEDEHLARFQQMQKDLSAGQKESTAYDPDNQGVLYLQAMAGGHVFDLNKDPAALLKGAGNLRDILKIAIGLEKDSVLFYLGIREMVPHKLGADKVDLIVKEEMRHMTALSQALAKA